MPFSTFHIPHSISYIYSGVFVSLCRVPYALCSFPHSPTNCLFVLCSVFYVSIVSPSLCYSVSVCVCAFDFLFASVFIPVKVAADSTSNIIAFKIHFLSKYTQTHIQISCRKIYFVRVSNSPLWPRCIDFPSLSFFSLLVWLFFHLLTLVDCRHLCNIFNLSFLFLLFARYSFHFPSFSLAEEKFVHYYMWLHSIVYYRIQR